MFCEAFPETGLCEGLPRKGSDVFQKAALGEAGREVVEGGSGPQRAVGECVSSHPAPAPTWKVSPALCENHDF